MHVDRDQHRKIVRLPGIGAYQWRFAERRLIWSEELARLYGLDALPDGVGFDAFVHPEDRQEVVTETHALLAAGGSFAREFRIVRPDGAIRHIHDRGVVEGGTGRFPILQGIHIDVTPHRSPLSVARDLSALDFREVAESLPQLVWTCDSSGCCDYLSPQWVAYVGAPEAEHLGFGWLDRLHPDDRERAKTRWRETAGNGRNFSVEFRIRRHDGAYRWFRTLAVPLRDASGRIRKWFGSNTDIEDLKRAEEALAESEARFRGVFENAATGISIADLDGRYVSCNPAYAAMLGYPAEELVGRSFSELVHPEDRPAKLALMAKLVAGEIPAFEIENRYRRKTGELLWARKHVSLLRDGRGRPTHIVTLATDMSAHKRHEALQQALVHELNHRAKNSLALIQSVARQTAARSPSEFLPRFEQRLQAIAAAQDLLVRRDWREVTVRDLLASQLAHFGGVDERVAAKGEEVAVTAAAAQTLGMAFHELATNAAKYGALSNEAGRIDVAWAVERGRDDEEMFRLEWVESGGPPVSPPDARGFGSALVERLVRSAFGGEVEYRFATEGVSWRLGCPASSVVRMG